MAKRTSLQNTESDTATDLSGPLRELLTSIDEQIEKVDAKLEAFNTLVEERENLQRKHGEIEKMLNRLEGRTTSSARAPRGSNLTTIIDYLTSAGGPRRISQVSEDTGINAGSTRATLVMNPDVFVHDKANKTFSIKRAAKAA